jgi:hypothetical protein
MQSRGTLPNPQCLPQVLQVPKLKGLLKAGRGRMAARLACVREIGV